MPVVFDTGALLRPRFQADEFTATKWDNSEVKAKFANDLCRFIAADFKESLFTKALYQRLSMCLGHIAHYNQRRILRRVLPQTCAARSTSSNRRSPGAASAIPNTPTATSNAP